MKKEAEENEERDRQEKEKIEKLNNADNLIFTTDKQLNDYGDKISEDNKEPIKDAIEKLREAHKNEDLETIDSATNELNEAWQAASQDMYQAQQEGGGEQDGGQQAGGEQSTNSSDDNVEDVDYEEVNDNNKNKDQ